MRSNDDLRLSRLLVVLVNAWRTEAAESMQVGQIERYHISGGVLTGNATLGLCSSGGE